MNFKRIYEMSNPQIGKFLIMFECKQMDHKPYVYVGEIMNTDNQFLRIKVMSEVTKNGTSKNQFYKEIDYNAKKGKTVFGPYDTEEQAVRVAEKYLKDLLRNYSEEELWHNYYNSFTPSLESVTGDDVDVDEGALTKEYVFQKVYENSDMIEESEHFASLICHLQDAAWDAFEHDSVEEFEDEFPSWLIAHSSFDHWDEEEYFEEYNDEDPAARF